MATFTGTSGDDEITPNEVTPGVLVVPVGSKPSAAADTIDGKGGNDKLDGGFGGDIINGGLGDDTIDDSPRHWTDDGVVAGVNAGNVIHGEAGNDAITITIVDSGGANPVGNAAYGDDGNDSLELIIHNDDPSIDWKGNLPTGVVSLDGGNGEDVLGVREWYVKAPGMETALYGGAGNDDLRGTVWTWEPDGSSSGGDNTDRLYGGTGDDSYLVLENKDLVIEKANEGYDTVTADKTDYILLANVEKLVMKNYAYYAEDLPALAMNLIM